MKQRLDLQELREKLAARSGPAYWRSLEELAGTEEFEDFLRHEFPENADTFLDPVGRRRFLQLMGASLAFAGFSACTRQPEERLVPYVRAPEETIPGKPRFYASALPHCGYAQGVLVESHDGRPTKIEGNEGHPASLGATNLFAQAAVLDLYDPDRAESVMGSGRLRTWDTLAAALRSETEKLQGQEGEGFRILTQQISSPTLSDLLDQFLQQHPGARWHQWEPVANDHSLEGTRLAFGRYTNTYYRFDRADVIVSFDSDFLHDGPAAVRYAKDFSARRRVEDAEARMNRLYQAESTPSVTASMADHRMRERPARLDALVSMLASELGISDFRGEGSPEEVRWVRAAAQDLKSRSGSSVVIGGEQLAAASHALIHVINETLGNSGQTVIHTEPVVAQPTPGLESLSQLVEDMQAGQVKTLLILGGNPVYDAPADFEFQAALEKVPLKFHLSSHRNETSMQCNWHIPESHPLEAWGDLRAFDGTASIVQPLIEPLFQSKSALETVAALLGKSAGGYDLVREYWQGRQPGPEFERWWRRCLHDGLVPDTAFEPLQLSADRAAVSQELNRLPERSGEDLDVIFRPDPSIFDGRYANNGWLQECPKPLTKLTWDNAALIGIATAEELGLQNEDVVSLSRGGATVEAPVWILPGHPEKAVTLHLGYGRENAGRVGDQAGFNAYLLRTSDALWSASDLEMTATGESRGLACTQDHYSMEGRHLVREATLEEFRANPHVLHEVGVHEFGEEADLYPGFEYEERAWGMTVDLNACIGCNACVVACQSENNVAIVGKEQVMNGREMHWLRIDRYFSGSLDDPETLNQPVMCQHCENAPCETVCPVAATVHSDEGLNDMVYNRCIGTRYCSNNCPYKVRRFNFLLYSDWQTDTLKLQRNPDVTVRSRGVMEKCSYCVQRINAAKIDAKLEDREIRDGEIRTACQQACPTDAIVFGDINDPSSKVRQLKENPRNYGILTELKTKPRTTYLGKITNPNPEGQEEESA